MVFTRFFLRLAAITVMATAFAVTSLAEPQTLVSASGTSGYSVPDGWTTSGTVEGGSYLKFDNGTLTSPQFPAHTGLSFEYTVATFGSGTNHPLTIRILNASTDAVIVEKTTATPTSSSYINTDSPISLGDISVPFKIQLYAPTGKGVRLRNYSIIGTPSGGGSSTYTVTYDANGGSGSMTDTSSPYDDGATVTVMDNEFTRAYYAFSKWNTAADGSGIDYDSGDTFTINSNTTLYAQWNIESGINVTTLTQSSLGLTGSYSSGASITIDGITYVHTDLSKSDSNIQVKATTGTIKNTSPFPGKILMLVINHSGTARATTINGSSDGSNWSEVESGSGTITADFSANNYKYFQITRGSNAAYWTNIQIYWKAPTVATPTFSIEPGNYSSTQNVTISCETDGATIYYTTDGTDPSESNGTEGNSVTISATTTLKAVAIKGDESSEIAIGVYSFPYTTIPSLFSDATLSSTPVNVTFGNWVVSGVNGNQVFVTDGTNGFIVYQSGHGFAVGNILSGTASCNLVLYNGAAEITGLTSLTEGLSVVTGGSVSPVTTTVDALGAVNTGSVITLNNLTYDGESLSDGVNSITPSKSLFAEAAFVNGKQYNITGVFSVNNTDKRILPRSAADIEEILVPVVTISSSIVNTTASGASGTIEVSYENFTLDSADLIFYESDGTTPASYDHSWLTASINASNNVAYSVSKNSGDARVAYFKVYALDGSANEYYSNLITINQAAGSVSYAVLPFTFNGGKSDIESKDGLSYNDLGSDYGTTNTKLKFDGTGDYVVLKFKEVPGELSFSIKGNSFSGGTFSVQASANGVDFSDVVNYTEVGGSEELKTISDLASNVRYIKWVYTEKVNGNVGLGNISLTKPASNPATITITATENGGKYYTTFYNGSARYVLPAGAKAFTMNSDHELYQLGADGSVIPSGTAVIIIAENASITLTKSDDESAIAVNGGANILQGSNSPKDIYSISGTPYVLGIVTGTLGFYEFTGDGIPAYKAYYEN